MIKNNTNSFEFKLKCSKYYKLAYDEYDEFNEFSICFIDHYVNCLNA